MRYIGKILLFFSSYLVLFIVLFLTELSKLNYDLFWLISQLLTLNFNLGPKLNYLMSNGTITISVIIYAFFIVLSLISIAIFKFSYRFLPSSTEKVLTISKISNGTSEVVSYLLTIIIPFVSSQTLSDVILNNNWTTLLVNLIILFSIGVLYVNSNLLVINPTIIFAGYSLYKIEYKLNNKEMSIDGILLTNKNFNPEKIDDKLVLNKIDEGIYLYRRV